MIFIMGTPDKVLISLGNYHVCWNVCASGWLRPEPISSEALRLYLSGSAYMLTYSWHGKFRGVSVETCRSQVGDVHGLSGKDWDLGVL